MRPPLSAVPLSRPFAENPLFSLRRMLALLAAFLLVAGLALPTPGLAGDPDAVKAYPSASSLLESAQANGTVRVIVKLKDRSLKALAREAAWHRAKTPDNAFSMEGVRADLALQTAIAHAAAPVLADMRGRGGRTVREYSHLPVVAMELPREALNALLARDDIEAVYEDTLSPPSDFDSATGGPDSPLLNNTVSIIGADTVWGKGFTGAGWYVAVLDTGILTTHEMFAGKTIVEACFSADSHCPNLAATMIGAGAAAHYPNTFLGWDHGTHVSGIAAGQSGTLKGVAPDANIIAVQVFSKFVNGCNAGTTDCVLSYASDQLAGLNYVYSLRSTYSIGAVNMSIGGGTYSSNCDGDSRKAAVDDLRAAGIPTAIASGNESYCGAIGAPACISSAIAIGAVTDADEEASFNNWHESLMELFAPGVAIYSSTGDSNTSYESWDGTSMATPHAAGALTLLRQAKSSKTVDQLQAALEESGVEVGTLCGGTETQPRLQVDAALNRLCLSTVTTTAISNITPTGATGGGNVTSEGDYAVTARGVCWNTTGSPTISDSKTVDGSGSGAFSSTLSGLSAATKYYVRAYSTSSAGTAYGAQVSFTTEGGPSVTSSDPADNEDDVAVNTTVSATFDRAIDPATLDEDSMSLTGGVQGTVTYDAATKTATFTPTADLDHATAYTLVVSTDVEDTYGVSLKNTYSATFITVAAADDADGDGAPDSEDDYPNDQSRGSVETAPGTGKALVNASGKTLKGLKSVAVVAADAPDGYEFPDGLVTYQVVSLADSATVTVTITFPSDIPPNARVYKVDDDGVYHNVTADASINGNVVTLTLTDGVPPGDGDNLVNGVIADPVGYAVVKSDDSGSGGETSSSSGGGGCTTGTGTFGFGFLALASLFWLVCGRVRVRVEQRSVRRNGLLSRK